MATSIRSVYVNPAEAGAMLTTAMCCGSLSHSHCKKPTQGIHTEILRYYRLAATAATGAPNKRPRYPLTRIFFFLLFFF